MGCTRLGRIIVGAYEMLAGSALPPNAAVYRSVPQIGMLERIGFFISHGGNNSTNEALAAGKPLHGTVTASRCIAWVAERKRPLCRKDGFPLTMTPAQLERPLAGDPF